MNNPFQPRNGHAFSPKGGRPRFPFRRTYSLLAFGLAICFELVLSHQGAQAEESPGGAFLFIANSADPTTLTITGYQGAGGAIAIPSTIDDCMVTSIGNKAFYGNQSLESVVLPDAVTNIGDYAFRNCSALKRVRLGSQLTHIGEYAFTMCSQLEHLSIPSSVAYIGRNAFGYCRSLKNVALSSQLTNIADSAFYNCSGIQGIFVRGDAPEWPTGLFSYADNATIYHERGGEGWPDVPEPWLGMPTTHWLSTNELFCVPHSEEAGTAALMAYHGDSTSLQIMPFVAGMDEWVITEIGTGAFQSNKTLSNLVICASVTNIGASAFQNCTNLSTLSVSDHLQGIGAQAFEGCSGLTTVWLPSTVSAIGECAFQNCTTLTAMAVPHAVTDLPPAVFAGCTNLRMVALGAAITNIGSECFAHCNELYSMILPKSVSAMGDAAFAHCSNLTELFFEGDAPQLGEGTFDSCTNLTLYVLPGSQGWGDVPGTWAGRPIEYAEATRMRVLTSNLTSGKRQKYETPGLNILKGLKPDIVAMQEFNYLTNGEGDIRAMVDDAFGPPFYSYREPARGIPNGIVSRWPILESGYWDDQDDRITDRNFAWSRIDIPGSTDLIVVSVHLKASSGRENEQRRLAQALVLKELIQANVPQDCYLIVAGDLNLQYDSEPAYLQLLSFLMDEPVPVDNRNNPCSNAKRVAWYDHVLFSPSLESRLIPVEMPSQVFSDGLVFDSRVYTPLEDVPPVQYDDSDADQMQHMAVVRDFRLLHAKSPEVEPPVLEVAPVGVQASQGEPVVLAIVGSGGEPLSFRWLRDGEFVPGMTNQVLAIDSLQPEHMGTYMAVVANAAGSITSTPVTISLVIPEPEIVLQTSREITWQGLSNLNYTVQGTTNLIANSWTNLTTMQSPTGELIYSLPDLPPGAFYLRITYP